MTEVEVEENLDDMETAERVDVMDMSSIPAKFDITPIAIEGLRKKYMEMEVKNVQDSDSYEQVKSGCKELAKYRNRTIDIHKKIKADALAYGRKCDEAKNEILEQLAPIENHLKSERKKVDEYYEREDQKKRDAAEEELQRRISLMASVGAPVEMGKLRMMTIPQFDIEYGAYKIAHEQREAIRLEAEERARVLKEESERVEEAKRQADAKELAVLREKAKQDETDRRAQQAKLDEANQIIAAAAAKKQAEADLLIKQEADRVKAEEDARALAAELIRQQELLPEKEKVLMYGDSLLTVPVPMLDDTDSEAIAARLHDAVIEAVLNSRTKLENI